MGERAYPVLTRLLLAGTGSGAPMPLAGGTTLGFPAAPWLSLGPSSGVEADSFCRLSGGASKDRPGAKPPLLTVYGGEGCSA